MPFYGRRSNRGGSTKLSWVGAFRFDERLGDEHTVGCELGEVDGVAQRGVNFMCVWALHKPRVVLALVKHVGDDNPTVHELV